jgi:hypothetical protein
MVFNIVTSRHCLDHLDPALAVGLGQLKRNDRVGLGRQSIAGNQRNQWELNWIVAGRP